MHILVADDDCDSRELLALALGPATDVELAIDGSELLDKIAEHGPFDLIITDVNMPGMQGMQVLASIREAGLKTPVLVVTGFSGGSLPATIDRMGNAMLLQKPFDLALFRAAVAHLVT